VALCRGVRVIHTWALSYGPGSFLAGDDEHDCGDKWLALMRKGCGCRSVEGLGLSADGIDEGIAKCFGYEAGVAPDRLRPTITSGASACRGVI